MPPFIVTIMIGVVYEQAPPFLVCLVLPKLRKTFYWPLLLIWVRNAAQQGREVSFIFRRRRSQILPLWHGQVTAYAEQPSIISKL